MPIARSLERFKRLGAAPGDFGVAQVILTFRSRHRAFTRRRGCTGDQKQHNNQHAGNGTDRRNDSCSDGTNDEEGGRLGQQTGMRKG